MEGLYTLNGHLGIKGQMKEEPVILRGSQGTGTLKDTLSSNSNCVWLFKDNMGHARYNREAPREHPLPRVRQLLCLTLCDLVG